MGCPKGHPIQTFISCTKYEFSKVVELLKVVFAQEVIVRKKKRPHQSATENMFHPFEIYYILQFWFYLIQFILNQFVCFAFPSINHYLHKKYKYFRDITSNRKLSSEFIVYTRLNIKKGEKNNLKVKLRHKIL